MPDRSATTSAATCRSHARAPSGSASGDPRLSLEERYTNHAGYVAAVRAPPTRPCDKGFLLPVDRDRLIQQAIDSTVLR